MDYGERLVQELQWGRKVPMGPSLLRQCETFPVVFIVLIDLLLPPKEGAFGENEAKRAAQTAMANSHDVALQILAYVPSELKSALMSPRS